MDENPTGGEVHEIIATIAKAGLILHTQPEDGRFRAWVVPAADRINEHTPSFIVEPVTRDTEVEAARAALAIYELHSDSPLANPLSPPRE